MATTETAKKKVREPLFHITRRASLPWWRAWLIRGVAILAEIYTLEHTLALHAALRV